MTTSEVERSAEMPDPAAPEEVRAYLLAGFDGERPSAPLWFDAAIGDQPEQSFIPVDGVDIEVLSWGDPAAPGLLLMHGQAAHAGWWRPIAPFLADKRHVVALSWSGMGASGWRDSYSTAGYEREAMAVMRAFEFFDREAKPVIVAHSLGGLPCAGLGSRYPDAFAQAVIIDSNVLGKGRKPQPGAIHSGHRYRSVAEALARFRFVRSLGQELPYVADLFAREGLMEVEGSDGVEWSWRFDPRTRTRFDRGDATIAAMGCPLSLIFGDRSIVVPPATRVAILEVAPAHTRAIVIPDCGHHVMAEQPIALIAALQALI